MSKIPDREPRLDEEATVDAGQPREELSGLAIRQPYRSAGPWLSPAAQRLIGLLGPRAVADFSPDDNLLVGTRGGLGVFERRGQREAIKELEDAELGTPEGSLASAGFVCTAPLRHSASAWRITGQLRGRASLLQLWIGSDADALVLAGPSAHEQFQTDPDLPGFSGHAQLDYVSAEEAAAVVTTWLGIGPSWFRPLKVSIGRDVYDARTGAAEVDATAPPGVPATLWDNPWMVWQIEQSGGPSSTFLNAAAAGHFQVIAADGQAVLERIPARNVYRHLVGSFAGNSVDLEVPSA